MRELETALVLLADRAEPLPTDVVVERLMGELAAEGIVTDHTPSDGPTPSGERTFPGPAWSRWQRHRWRRLIALGGAAAVTLIAAIATVLVLGQDGGSVAIQPAAASTTEGLVTSPWKQFREQNPEWVIPSAVSDDDVFIAAYNSAFRAQQSCEQAYETAKSAYEGLHRSLDEWNDEVDDRPGLEYDAFAGELNASTNWLMQHGCAGAADFLVVG